MRTLLLLLTLLLVGCNTTPDDRLAFYTSVLIQEAWFARQAEPAPDAWKDFESALQNIPELYREPARKAALEQLEKKYPHVRQN